MSEERHSYAYNRVLIESARVLSAQFDDAVIHITGAQLELLRNVTQYLNRITTYVSETQPGYYLTPDVSDFDDILVIVSDLEETLMGNLNTIFGYKDSKHLGNATTVSGAGTKTLNTGSVPAGEVWRIETFVGRNQDTACSRISLKVGSGTGPSTVLEKDSPGIDELVQWTGLFTLPAGANLVGSFEDCADGDRISIDARGYTMEIPS